MSYFWRIAEERILDAQRAGAFDDLPGKGKPLNLEDLSWVPEDLRIGYHILKNANVLPPEAELLKDVHTLEDLLKHVEDEGQRRALAKSIQFKMIRLDLLKRRSRSMTSVRDYSRKLVAKFGVQVRKSDCPNFTSPLSCLTRRIQTPNRVDARCFIHIRISWIAITPEPSHDRCFPTQSCCSILRRRSVLKL